MHKIQKFIIGQLMEEEALRYSDMRPPRMEASQFMYHLNKLIQAGLVVKREDGKYGLSSRGRQYVDRADTDVLDLREQPRLAALIWCTHPELGTLYIRRGFQPALGWLGFPLLDIPMNYGNSLNKFIGHEFEQETGLTCDFNHRADGYVKLVRNDELEANLMAHVMCAEFKSGELKNKSNGVDYLWSKEPPSEIANLLPSTAYIIEQLSINKSFFFFEYELNIE